MAITRFRRARRAPQSAGRLRRINIRRPLIEMGKRPKPEKDQVAPAIDRLRALARLLARLAAANRDRRSVQGSMGIPKAEGQRR